MFDQVFDSMRKATESTIHMQQEMFKNWTSLWPGFPSAQPAGAEQMVKFQKKWAEIMAELVKKQSEAIEAELRAGLANLEGAFRLAEAKDVPELHHKTIELWQKALALRQCSEAQAHNFQTAMAQWTELMMKGAAYSWATS